MGQVRGDTTKGDHLQKSNYLPTYLDLYSLLYMRAPKGVLTVCDDLSALKLVPPNTTNALSLSQTELFLWKLSRSEPWLSRSLLVTCNGA